MDGQLPPCLPKLLLYPARLGLRSPPGPLGPPFGLLGRLRSVAGSNGQVVPAALRALMCSRWQATFRRPFQPLQPNGAQYRAVMAIKWSSYHGEVRQVKMDDFVKQALLGPVADMDVTALRTFLVGSTLQLVDPTSALGKQVH